MKLDIHIIKDSEVTIREQLFEQIVFLIATGRLKPGEVLPTAEFGPATCSPIDWSHPPA